MAKRQVWIEVRVPVDIEAGKEGLIYGTSPFIKGLLVAEQTEEKTIEQARIALGHMATLTAMSR